MVGPTLDCGDSVAAAIALLERDDADIVSIRFEYGPCPCAEGVLCDCAIHRFGTVTVDVVDGLPKEISIRMGSDGRPVASLE